MFAPRPCFAVRCLLVLAASLALVTTNAVESSPGAKRMGEQGRLREGSKLTDVPGRMELVGDQATFTPATGNESYRLLENLALERISQILSDSRDKSQWEISGTVTEYRGSNYLLVTKAVIKSSTSAVPASPPAASGKTSR